ncbi:MAG: Spy/CpxP family protein refolding chaperone [Methylocella sp.]
MRENEIRCNDRVQPPISPASNLRRAKPGQQRCSRSRVRRSKVFGRRLRRFHRCAHRSAESRPKLTPAQEKNWPALETALREQAKARAARIAEWREKAKEPREHRSVIEGLQQGAKRLAARSAELEKLADAAKPLYDSLDDSQKGRFRPLLHIAGGKHRHHEHEGFRHS